MTFVFGIIVSKENPKTIVYHNKTEVIVKRVSAKVKCWLTVMSKTGVLELVVNY